MPNSITILIRALITSSSFNYSKVSNMYRNKSASSHSFAMVPRSDVPRSRFTIESTHKTTFDAGYLVPIFVDEVLPGDTFQLSNAAFGRMATPIFPLMDNIYLDTFFFFVPNRLLWDNWVKFMGEQTNPGDSIDFKTPIVESPLGGYPVGSLQDHMGLPTVGQVLPDKKFSHNVFHLRAYNLIWNEWFRDENLQNSVTVDKGNGPDNPINYKLLRRGKRHDYFTSALPWPQKGSSVMLPLGGSAPVNLVGPAHSPGSFKSLGGANAAAGQIRAISGGGIDSSGSSGSLIVYDPGSSLVADLSTATASTINQIRQAFQIQKLLERDARGGTRYTEIIRSHFGVISPDARLQRPEYLGGSSAPISITTVAQTSATPESGDETPLGNLAGIGTVLCKSRWSQSFTEHGVIIGLASIRADLTYQQGVRKMWGRRSRYDYYFPAFAHLGEQIISSWEIYADGSPGDFSVFGYQERWAEYRYHPSMITGLFRSTAAQTLDAWHLSQKFLTRPALGATFIEENPPIDRVIAVNTPNSAQFIFDSLFKMRVARPLPMYSVPGFVDHF